MRYELYQDDSGEWRWRLVSANNRNIANGGESYKNKEDALAAIRLVRATGDVTVQVVEES